MTTAEQQCQTQALELSESANAQAIIEKENARLTTELSKLRRELLSRTAREEDFRSKLTSACTARDVALADGLATQEALAQLQDQVAQEKEEVVKAKQADQLEITTLRQRLSQAEALHEEAQTQATTAAAQAVAADTEQATLLDQLTVEVERMREEQSSLIQAAERADTERVRLEATLEEMRQSREGETSELLQQVEAWEQEAGEAVSEGEQHAYTVKALEAEAAQLHAELGALRQQHADAKAELAQRARAAEAEVVELRMHIGSVEDSSALQVEEVENSARLECAALQSKVEDILNELTEAEERIKVEEGAQAAMKAQLEAADKETAKHQTAAAQAEAALIEVESAHRTAVSLAEENKSRATIEMEEQLSHVNALESRVVELSTEVARLTREKTVASQEVEQLQSRNAHVQSTLQTELSALRVELQSLRTAKAADAERIATKETQLQGLGRDVLELTQQLNEANTPHDATATTAAAVQEAVASYTSRMKEMEAELARNNEERQRAQQAQEFAERQLQATEAKLAEQKSRREAVEASYAEIRGELASAIDVDAEQAAQTEAQLKRRLQEVTTARAEIDKLRVQVFSLYWLYN